MVMAAKLKHIALKEIHYQLLNTCLIISSQAYSYCVWWKYSGCRSRPSHDDLLGTRNYCKICQIKKFYNMDRMYNLKTIQQTWKLYVELKKDLHEFQIITGHRNFWFRHYSRQFTGKYRGMVKRMQLTNYIKQSYMFLCSLNP